jgi:phenylpyruvate tautomerase PptA (4-oxalocrotonate tautomerase family)
MPSTRIETSAGWINGRHAELIAAVQRALVEGIRIPENDRSVRVLEYPPSAFAAAPGRSANFTLIEISMFEGRSIDAKRRLYAALARELQAFGVAAEDVKVVIHDEPRENWGLRGKAATDIELGFRVDV